jgi:hypothetical protein
MKLSRKVTNFIRLEEGNIGRKSAVVTGALLASSVLGGVLASAVDTRIAEAYLDGIYCDEHLNSHIDHYNTHTNSGHSNHFQGWMPPNECP